MKSIDHSVNNRIRKEPVKVLRKGAVKREYRTFGAI